MARVTEEHLAAAREFMSRPAGSIHGDATRGIAPSVRDAAQDLAQLLADREDGELESARAYVSGMRDSYALMHEKLTTEALAIVLQVLRPKRSFEECLKHIFVGAKAE